MERKNHKISLSPNLNHDKSVKNELMYFLMTNKEVKGK
jgi:hypothetical protein